MTENYMLLVMAGLILYGMSIAIAWQLGVWSGEERIYKKWEIWAKRQWTTKG